MIEAQTKVGFASVEAVKVELEMKRMRSLRRSALRRERRVCRCSAARNVRQSDRL